MEKESVKLHRYAIREVRRIDSRIEASTDVIANDLLNVFFMETGTALCILAMYVANNANAEEAMKKMIGLTGVAAGTAMGYYFLRAVQQVKKNVQGMLLKPYLERLFKKSMADLSLKEEIVTVGGQIHENNCRIARLRDIFISAFAPLLGTFLIEMDGMQAEDLVRAFFALGVGTTGYSVSQFITMWPDYCGKKEYLEFLLISDAEMEMEEEPTLQRTL